MKKPRGKGFSKRDVDRFDWGLYPKAQAYLKRQVSFFLSRHSLARRVAQEMHKKTSTYFFDWIDHIVLPYSSDRVKRLSSLGFEQQDVECPEGVIAFKHTHSIFFTVLLSSSPHTQVVLKPEVLTDFTKKWGKIGIICGKPLSRYRSVAIKKQGSSVLCAVERRGYAGFVVEHRPSDMDSYKRALQVFQKRKRKFSSDHQGIEYTYQLIKKTLKSLSPSRSADAFFRGERKYWQSRNKTGQVQKKRQDALGLGWGNHDHHTYRCSRDNFLGLVRIFENLGFKCRERFYAGKNAGWGAQILEHPDCDIVLFCDVDLKQSDRHIDFAHRGFRAKHKLGTVGLWIGLHGESILQAGMHHLEARFDFHKLKKDLLRHHISIMPPFSNFSFLKQAFTFPEQWKVEKTRANRLLIEKLITQDQHDEFLVEGAIGSHMENLQRKQGFKGFNQDSVSVIIKSTDPRKLLHHRGA